MVPCWPRAGVISQSGSATDNVQQSSLLRATSWQVQPNRQLCGPQPISCLSGAWDKARGVIAGCSFSGIVSFVEHVRHAEFSFSYACRVGEAQNPGPWSFLLRNVVSANKHADDLNLTNNCTAWSETSANAATLAKLHKRARLIKGYLASSAPWNNKRPEQSSGGRSSAAGTLLLSRHHAKSLHSLWDKAIWQSARVTDCLIQLSDLQVRVVVVYGVHSGVAGASEQNEMLFAEIFRMIGCNHIPTLVTGDFNCDLRKLGCWQCALDKGFVDVGEKVAALTGEAPQPTYKGVSRLDYIVCCPLAFRALETFAVDPNGFTDHGLLQATFRWEAVMARIPKWSLPCDLAKLCQLQQHFRAEPISPQYQAKCLQYIQSRDTSAAFRCFAEGFEDKFMRVHLQVLGSKLPVKFLGRFEGKVRHMHPVPPALHPTQEVVTDRVRFNMRARAISRLQHLRHLLAKNCQPAQCCDLWKKLHSDGSFSPDFATWLIEQDICSLVPVDVPSLQWIDGILPSVLHDFKLMQSSVAREQRIFASRAFEQDWKKGGKLHAASVKPESPARVDSLLRETLLHVSPLRTSKGDNAKFRVREPQLVQMGSKWCFGKFSAAVYKIEEDLVTLDCPMKIDMYRKTVKQKAWCTDPAWLFDQFSQFWSSYWNHSRPVVQSQAQYLVHALPRLPAFNPEVTTADVLEAVRRLKVGKARGLDGFSNFELQCVHEEDAQLLALLFNSILLTGEWPDEMCNAAVALLAKVEQPQVPKDGRPITILSSLYRLFGKFFSKKILEHWLPHLPEALCGSIPGRSSTDAAWNLAARIEEAMASDRTVFGGSLDLSKAYNLLPRDLVMQMAVRTGWPPPLAEAYSNFLSKLKRYFKLADGLWGPVQSTVGVPEGCPLAVSCMIVVTWALTARISGLGVSLVSYVDNWSAQMWDSSQLVPFLQEVSSATQTMQLLLNSEKTRVYSNCPAGRQLLRNIQFQGSPLQVCLRLDDLGVDFNVGRQVMAASLLRRVEAVQPRLMKLQRAPWAHSRKAHVLLRVVHPAVSFGCEFASTSLSTCSLLRGKYSAAIFGPASHRNHFLTPLLGLEVQYEPFVLFLLRRLNTLRRVFVQDSASTCRQWDVVISASSPATGPYTYLLAQLRCLGWVPQPGLLCLGTSGESIHLCLSSKQELKASVCNAWWQVIAKKLPDQPGYSRAPLVSLPVSLSLRKVAKCSHSIVGSFTVGAALSSGQKRHFLSSEEALCKHCGCQDGYTHRLRFCPKYASARAHIPRGLLETIDDEILLRGLWPEAPAGTDARRLFESLEHPVVQECLDDGVHLFTDGSTQPHAFVPVSTWAVVLADPCSMDNAIVERGMLPGRQDNFRAELYAVFVAVQTTSSATLYSDNFSVVLGFRVLLARGWVHSRFLQHAETSLWWDIWQKLAPKRTGWRIQHVKSHSKPKPGESFAERWQRCHNDAADEAAKSVYRELPSQVADVRQNARQAYDEYIKVAKLVFSLQESIVRGTSRLHDQAQSLEQTTCVDLAVSSNASIQNGLVVGFGFQPQDFADALLGPRFLWVVQAWMKRGTWVKSSEWVSILELYIHFVVSTGWLAPVNVAAWNTGRLPPALQTGSVPQAFICEADYASLALSRPPLGKQATVFLHAFKDVCKRLELEIKIERRQTLQPFGCTVPVASTCVVPRDIRQPPHELFHRVFHGVDYPAITRAMICAPVQALHCPVPLRSPVAVWNCYTKLTRATRKRRNA